MILQQKETLVNFWKSKSIKEEIIQAFQAVPREHFLHPDLKERAYEDRPFPTIRGQSISQPTTVIMMTQALDIQPEHKVLEIGAGVGYQAAILSKLAKEVVTTEIIPELVHAAKNNTSSFSNVKVIETDGSRGVEEEAPFDRVMITAACPKIPDPVVKQVKEGGVIIAPVGTLREQTMVRATKRGDNLDLEFLGSFMFVPLQGKYGFE